MEHEHQCCSAAKADCPFNASEAATLHQEDRAAGKNIVLLMVGIFVMGLLGYAYVSYYVYHT